MQQSMLQGKNLKLPAALPHTKIYRVENFLGRKGRSMQGKDHTLIRSLLTTVFPFVLHHQSENFLS